MVFRETWRLQKSIQKKQFFIEIFKGQKVMNSPGFPLSIHGVQKNQKKKTH